LFFGGKHACVGKTQDGVEKSLWTAKQKLAGRSRPSGPFIGTVGGQSRRLYAANNEFSMLLSDKKGGN
jgi:hypothetical protein